MTMYTSTACCSIHELTPDIDEACSLRAVADKEAKYPELARQNQYGELTVLAGETRGRWHQRALTTVSTLIEAKTQTIAPLFRQASALARHRRWCGIPPQCSSLGSPRDGEHARPRPGTSARRLVADRDALEIPEVSLLP